MQPSSQLIQPTQWDPVGESMYSILAKLQTLNLLDWVEFRNSFGPKTSRSFHSTKSQEPDDAANFPLSRFALLLGWMPDQLASSFSTFYKPSWMNDRDKIAQHEKLRVCPICLASGVHLIMHQFLDFEKCPIHGSELTCRFPCCDAETPSFRIQIPFEEALQCSKCGGAKCSTSRRIRLQSERKHLVRSYQSWMLEIDSKFFEDPRRLWLDGPHHFRDLLVVDQYMPGPDWVQHSFSEGKYLSRNRFQWRGELVKLPPEDAKSTMELSYKGPAPHSTAYETPRFVSRYLDSLSEQVMEFGRKLRMEFVKSNIGHSIFEMDPNICVPQYGDACVWHAAYWLWRRLFDDAFPIDARWQRSRGIDYFGEGILWHCWSAGPGSLLFSRQKGFWQMENVLFVKWLSEIWVKNFLETTFTLFVGAASREVHQGWLNTQYLAVQQHPVGRHANYVVVMDGEQTYVDQFSTISPFPQVKSLHQTGVNFLDFDIFKSFGRLKSLQDILGMPIHDRKLWFADWKDAKRSDERRQAFKASM